MPNSQEITDQEILDWLRSGILLVDLETKYIRKIHRGDGRYRKVSIQRHPESGRARVTLGHGTRRRLIYLNRLIYMAGTLQLIPDGYVVDHKNLDRTDDSFHNLQLHSHQESYRQGYDQQLASAWRELNWYFDCLIFLGREPQHDAGTRVGTVPNVRN